MARYKSYGIPNQFSLGNTPLNEALIFCNELIPMFKKKYDIEKMTFVTLTDGGANSFQRSFYNTAEYGTDEWYNKKMY
jgi:Mg-chelatase subunit ChlD